MIHGANADPARLSLTRRWPARVEALLEERFAVDRNLDDAPLGHDRLRRAMQRADILCPTVTDRIDDAVISVRDRRVRLIANYGAGVDHIDLDAARAAGIRVSNTPDVLTDATADLALMLMLMASRRAGEGERELRAGGWTGWRPTHMLGTSLRGKRLGVVGFGRIGRALAERARPLGMTIAYHSRTRAAPDVEAAYEASFAASIDTLAAEADVMSLHCAGGPATHHLVDAALLARMKPTAIIVNTARGSVVNGSDLARALATGRLAAAGLDVFEHEPAIEPALLGLQNVVLLPHLGSATLEAREAMGMRVLANIESFLAGRELPDRVA